MDELEDLTGIGDRLVTLKGPVVLERRPSRVAVRIPGRHVEVVQRSGLIEQPLGRRSGGGKLGHYACDDIAPRLLSEPEMERLDCLLCRLVGCEAGPLVPLRTLRVPRLIQIASCLSKPVVPASSHTVPSGSGQEN